MLYLLVAIVVFIFAFKLGRKYGEFLELMTARRIMKLMEERKQFNEDLNAYRKAEKQEELINLRLKDLEDDSKSKFKIVNSNKKM